MLQLQFIRQNGDYQIHLNGVFSHDLTREQLNALFEVEVADSQALEDYGRSLYDRLFPAGSPAHTAFQKSITGPDSAQRLYLVFGDHAELSAVPWEYMHDGTRYIAMRHHVLRALPTAQRRAWKVPDTPPDIYALLSDPALSNNMPIAVEKAWDDLTQVVQQQRGVSIERLLPPTLNQLRTRLSPKTFNLVHILCHGTVTEEGRGKAALALEDTYGNEVLTPADRVIDTLTGRAGLVVLNACMSAQMGENPLSNLAYALVRDAVPYALGMQFKMAESAAFVLTQMLYTELLKGGSIEEAVRQARNSIFDTHGPLWAGVPALYTALDGDTSPAITPGDQPAIVTPSPALVMNRQKLGELAASDVLIGRGPDLVKVATELQRERDRRPAFITLFGIGGIGKTSLAAEAARRNAWAFEHRVVGLSLEVLPAAASFVNRLAEAYLGTEAIDPAWDAQQLRDQVIARVRATPSILLLDNLETLIDAAHPDDRKRTPNPEAVQIESIILNLAGGATVLLITSRVRTGWDGEKVIELEGLSDPDGARLFVGQLKHRAADADVTQAQAVSTRVLGHPLALRLLAWEFDRDHRPLDQFMADAESELVEAENRAAARNLKDPNRHKTLIACIEYSVARLSPELRDMLRTLLVFQNPFLPELAAVVTGEEKAESTLRSLLDRSLLTYRLEPGLDGDRVFELPLYSLHPMLRWYIDWTLDRPDQAVWQRYGVACAALAAEVQTTYWQRKRSRRLIDVCLDDLLAATDHLDARARRAPVAAR